MKRPTKQATKETAPQHRVSSGQSERLTVIADSLKFSKAARAKWLAHVRKLLLDNGGRVMRTIAAMQRQYKIKSSKRDEFDKATGYLKNQKRYKKFDEMKSKRFPIGSGVVESACKQIVCVRMKLAVMLWKMPGAQAVMTLGCIKLSNIWKHVFAKMLEDMEPFRQLIKNQPSHSAVLECARLGSHPAKSMGTNYHDHQVRQFTICENTNRDSSEDTHLLQNYMELKGMDRLVLLYQDFSTDSRNEQTREIFDRMSKWLKNAK